MMEIEIIQKTFLRTSRIEHPIGHIWFIHPFGESGLCYKEAFHSRLVEKFNLYVPDLPGFGASPNYGRARTMEELVSCLVGLIDEISAHANLFIVAHSVSGLIGTELCKHYKDKVKGFISVEGNLLEIDSYYSSLPINHSENDFHKIYTDSVFEKAASRIDFRRYLSSIYFAEIDSLVQWGKSTEKYISGDKPGVEFMHLTCPKRYVWGDKDTPAETQEFIEKNRIPNIYFEGIGHWPMIEVPEKFYNAVGDFFSKTTLEYSASE
ncbi:MAG: alpha/beta hydrolase [Bacteroidota bacterium]